MNLDKIKKKQSFPKLLILEEHKWTAVKIHGVSKQAVSPGEHFLSSQYIIILQEDSTWRGRP